MTPACELPNGVLRQWHVYNIEGLCACGARETKLTPIALPTPAPKYIEPKQKKIKEPKPIVDFVARRRRREAAGLNVETITSPVPVEPIVERRAPEPPGEPGLICPGCNIVTITNVTDSRAQPGRIKRRRECTKCDIRFSTFERIGTDDDDRRKR